MNWSEEVVLVTGGTGSFGKKFVEIMLREYRPKRLVIFSRDELKQHDMRAAGFDHSSLRYFIGDVRDAGRLERAFAGVTVVVHAAALKQVPACEYNPFEAIQTNIMGGRNVIDAAINHCSEGVGIWQWASNDAQSEPDVVMACAGDVPTLETLAAVSILREHLPALKIRVVNVVDLMKLQPATEHPHGLNDKDFDSLFTQNKPVIFAFHAYPWLIHRLTYRRTNHHNIHVRGYKEEGTITTPFDMAVLNDLDRFHLVGDAVDRLPMLGARGAYLKQRMTDLLTEHRIYIRKHGEDMPSIRGWRWPQVP